MIIEAKSNQVKEEMHLLKKIAVFVLLSIFLVTLPALAEENTLRIGSQGERVLLVEKYLDEHGYDVGVIAPYYTYVTKKAVEQFQADHNLPITGEVDAATWNALTGNSQDDNSNKPEPKPNPEPSVEKQPNDDINHPSKPRGDNEMNVTKLQIGDSGQEVYRLEKELDRRGYNVGTVAPYYTFLTSMAVRAFQLDKGLSPTGTADANTLEALGFIIPGEAESEYPSENQELVRDTPAEPEEEPAAEPVPVQEPEPVEDSAPDPAYAPGLEVTPGNPEAELAPVSALNEMERQMVELVNRERSINGLQPLKVNLRLVRSARMKSQDMIDNGYFGHYGGSYGSPWTLIRKAEPDYRAVGENLVGNHSVTAAHEALMRSAGHRKNILSENYTEVGIGIVRGGPYGYMFTQHFIGK